MLLMMAASYGCPMSAHGFTMIVYGCVLLYHYFSDSALVYCCYNVCALKSIWYCAFVYVSSLRVVGCIHSLMCFGILFAYHCVQVVFCVV